MPHELHGARSSSASSTASRSRAARRCAAWRPPGSSSARGVAARRLRRRGGHEEATSAGERRRRRATRRRRSARSPFSNWPLYIDKKTSARTGRRRTGGNDQVHRGLQRQRGVLRQGPPGARARPADRPRPRRADGLDGRRAGSTSATPSRSTRPTSPTPRTSRTSLASPPYDPERNFTLPWQSGITGIGYNPKKTGREAHERQRPVRPQVQGPRDDVHASGATRPGSCCSGMGKDPTTASKDDYLEAIEKIDKENRKGQIRRFTGNDYTKDLAAGNLWACVAWSGDLVQLKADNPNLEFLDSRGGRHDLVGQHADPQAREGLLRRRDVHELRLRPRDRRADRRRTSTTSARSRAPRRSSRRRIPRLASNTLIFPDDADAVAAARLPVARPGAGARDHRGDAEGHRGVTTASATVAPGRGGKPRRSRRALLPAIFVAPGLAWLIVFYAIPIATQLWVSLQTGNPDDGFTQTWNWSVYPDASRRVPRAADPLVRVRGDGDGPLLRHRLPAGLLHRVQGGKYKQPLPAARSSCRSSRARSCGPSPGRRS